MEVWRNLENRKCENIEKNWKYGKFIKCEIANMENVKEDNRNKRGSIVCVCVCGGGGGGGGGGGVKAREGIQ